MPLNSIQKEFLLGRIFDSKEILFDSFKGAVSITKRKRRETWEQIANELKDQGACDKDVEVSYLRDTVWQNLKKNTLRKVDLLNRTGGAGSKLSEIEHRVLDIIGRNSAIVSPVKMRGSRKRQEKKAETVTSSPTPSTITLQLASVSGDDSQFEFADISNVQSIIDYNSSIESQFSGNVSVNMAEQDNVSTSEESGVVTFKQPIIHDSTRSCSFAVASNSFVPSENTSISSLEQSKKKSGKKRKVSDHETNMMMYREKRARLECIYYYMQIKKLSSDVNMEIDDVEKKLFGDNSIDYV